MITRFTSAISNRAARYAAAAILTVLVGVFALLPGCSKRSTPAQQLQTPVPPSQVEVRVETGAAPAVVLKTTAAEFEVSKSGYITAYLLRDGQRLTLDHPQQTTGGPRANRSADVIVVDGKETSDFALDPTRPKITAPQGKLGSRGKRVELTGRSASTGLEETFAIEVYDEFPNLAVTATTYKNAGRKDVRLGKVIVQRHWLDASKADTKAPPYRMWSFHGASIRWGKDDVLQIPRNFSQQNQFGALVKVGGDLDTVGGGIPVVAFWTATVGEAIGHVETLPLVLSLPVQTTRDGLVGAALAMESNVTLRPGEALSSPRSFVAVYAGDYYEPLSLYSSVLEREGLTRPKLTNEDYGVSWCGWGYEFNVTPAQMLGTIPKLRELGIHWATLDDRWFENYGDWEPRRDTFPDNAIQKMVRGFHEKGIKVQLWWLPLAAEDGAARYASHTYALSKVVQEHPEWLVLDPSGKPARMARNLATLCPAVPEVQAYYKKLTERFIREWDFDGHKLDNIYTVPACYNPKHRHKSPEDSIYAMGDVYKIIFETTRALKPESITQSCPCGTPPNLAWLRYMDQAVTADPVGSVQVRRRIKMYKALLGPQAAVYGDHVELTRIVGLDRNEQDLGQDFASTLGVGGVLGTKFTWPDAGPKFRNVYLTPQKDAQWKKWIGLYNEKMLSRGIFRNLYVYGYDVPESYAIEKDGKMYYAFFAPDLGKPWKGEVELRGLAPGRYRVLDYVDGKDLGIVTSPNARLAIQFTEHLLVEVSGQ